MRVESKISHYLPLALMIAVLLVSLIVEKAYHLVHLQAIIVGAVFVALIILILGAVMLVYQAGQFHQQFDAILQRLKELIPPAQVHWLYSDAELAEKESNAPGKEIWIVSPDLKNV